MRTPVSHSIFLLSVTSLLSCEIAAQAQEKTRPKTTSLRLNSGTKLKVRTDTLIQEAQQNIWLVRANCISHKNIMLVAKMTAAKWRIAHVYSGPKKLLKQQFETVHPNAIFFDGGTSRPGFLPDIDAEAIYAVRFVKGRLEPVFTSTEPGKITRLTYGVWWPHLKNYPYPPKTNSKYPQDLLYAESIERVAKAPLNEQVRLLYAYAYSPVAELRVWAVSTLAENQVEGAQKLLLNFANDTTLPIIVQLAVDAGLQRLDEGKNGTWSNSAARFNLLQRLATSPATRTEVNLVMDHLIQLAQTEQQAIKLSKENNRIYTPGIDSARLLELWGAATSNANWSWISRFAALNAAGKFTAPDLVPRALAFKYWITQVLLCNEPTINPQEDSDRRIRRYLGLSALNGLAKLRPFTAEEANDLRALKERLTSQDAHDAIDAALK